MENNSAMASAPESLENARNKSNTPFDFEALMGKPQTEEDILKLQEKFAHRAPVDTSPITQKGNTFRVTGREAKRRMMRKAAFYWGFFGGVAVSASSIFLVAFEPTAMLAAPVLLTGGGISVLSILLIKDSPSPSLSREGRILFEYLDSKSFKLAKARPDEQMRAAFLGDSKVKDVDVHVIYNSATNDYTFTVGPKTYTPPPRNILFELAHSRN